MKKMEKAVKVATRAAKAAVTDEQQSASDKPVKENATLAEIRSGKYDVHSIDPAVWQRNDVLPVVVLCYLVTAVAIDCDPDALAIHKKNMPHIPVARMLMNKWKDTKELIAKYLTGRDIEKARQETEWFVTLMQQMEPAIWTLENVPSLRTGRGCGCPARGST